MKHPDEIRQWADKKMVSNRDKFKNNTFGGIFRTEILYNGYKITSKWWEFVQLSIKKQVFGNIRGQFNTIIDFYNVINYVFSTMFKKALNTCSPFSSHVSVCKIIAVLCLI